MLNPFPSLLIYGILAPTLIRVAIGAVLFYLAVHHWRGRADIARTLSVLMGRFSSVSGPLLALIELMVGAALIVGLYTQIAALIAFGICLKSSMVRSKLSSLAPLSHTTYILLAAMSLSLMVTGAGAFAFDIPL